MNKNILILTLILYSFFNSISFTEEVVAKEAKTSNQNENFVVEKKEVKNKKPFRGVKLGLGLGIDYLHGFEKTRSDIFNNISITPVSAVFPSLGFTPFFTLGYGYVFENGIYVATEFEYGIRPISVSETVSGSSSGSDATTVNLTMKTSSNIGVVFKLGYSIKDRVLLYGLVGYDTLLFSYDMNVNSMASGVVIYNGSSSSTQWLHGFRIGLGSEVNVLSFKYADLSLFTEIFYRKYTNVNIIENQFTLALQGVQVRGGINIRFGLPN